MRARASLTALSFSVVLAAALAGLAAAPPSAAEVAAAVQLKYETVKDFSADFLHVYRGGVLKKQVSERGKVLIKKPGKMRWNYGPPENNVFVSDGIKISSYIPSDKQVIITPVPPEDAATTPALFLAGKGNLTRDFTASLTDAAAGVPAGTIALKLVPRTPQADYDWLVLEVDPGTYQLRGLVTTDAQGGTSTFSFTNLKENVRLADTEFEFKPPRGVDVVNDSAHR